ncbi:MAG: helix-turn-helix transcriptional regulator [Bacteroidaceae bacterium]|nr:helix-turn-helix transcriptional regulator [Bacteroidaceae bacterium]
MKIQRVNIGNEIFLRVKDKGLSQAQFADAIGLKRQNVKKTVFDKESVDTNLLCRISEVLDCNFFDYYKSNTDYDKQQELRATLTIELGKERKDKTFRFVFGENNIEILNK